MSERDGWNHLYLYDGVTGAVKNQITKGNWPVRDVIKVDEDKRQIWFSANGMYPGKDPYFVHYYRINFDGTGLTPLTQVDANHVVNFSTDMAYYVDAYSRVDMAPVSELHRSDGTAVAELDRGDITELVKAGWKPPEVFIAQGRDGKTDIWGVIYRPTQLRSGEEVPRHREHLRRAAGSFVPKSFAALQPDAGAGRDRLHRRADRRHGDQLPLEGVPRRRVEEPEGCRLPRSDPVAQGGGREIPVVRHHARRPLRHVSRRPERARRRCCSSRTSTRWRSRRPAVTTTGWTRSGGTSSGWDGRSAPNTPKSSNVDNAYRLQGKVLLVVGEMDNNVDPSSTLPGRQSADQAQQGFRSARRFPAPATPTAVPMASTSGSTSSRGTCSASSRRTGRRSRTRRRRHRRHPGSVRCSVRLQPDPV